MAVERPSLGNLPRRGPAIQTTASALRPPSTCTVAAPPASRKPAPTPKFVPRAPSHPLAQIQCAARGKTMAARMAAEAQPAASLQRSAPEPHGSNTTIATDKNSNNTASWDCGAAALRPWRRKGPRPSTLQGFPAKCRTTSAGPRDPAKEAPTNAKTMAATAMRARLPSMA